MGYRPFPLSRDPVEEDAAMPWFQPMKVPAEGPQTRPSAIPRVAKKSFSVEEARGGRGGGRGGGEGEGTRASHSWLSPPRVVACHASHVPACPLFFPPLVSSLTALLRLLCRTEIVIYVRTTFPSFSSENRTDLSSFFALLRVLLVSI